MPPNKALVRDGRFAPAAQRQGVQPRRHCAHMEQPRSSHNPAFTKRIADWIQAHGEVLVLIRWPNAGGSKSFEFFREMSALMARIAPLPERTSVIVFRQPQLPIRGRVDDELIRRALEHIPEDTEFLIAGLDLVTYGRYSYYTNASGESHDELVATLRDWRQDHRVAVGRYPEWWEDTENVTSAYVPDMDGNVRLAAY
jgi:hypothetical protein